MARLSPYLGCAPPPATYFAFPKLKTDRLPNYSGSLDFAKKLLTEVGLAVVPGIAFGPEGEDHIRISFGRSPEDISEGVRRLTAYFEQFAK